MNTNLAQYNSIAKKYGTANAINHMIRTPITCVLGFNHLLNSTNLNAEQKKYVQGIAESAKQLLLFLDNLTEKKDANNERNS